MYDRLIRIGDEARGHGLTITQYLCQNYTREELDRIQIQVKLEMDARQVAIDRFKGSTAHHATHVDLGHLDREELDAMQERVMLELSRKKAHAKGPADPADAKATDVIAPITVDASAIVC